MASVASGGRTVGAVVPTCPGWTVADLAKHTGIIHRWATEIVATRAPRGSSSVTSMWAAGFRAG